MSGRVFDAEDLTHLVDSSLDFWLTTGRFAHQFERRFAKEVFGRRHAILVNSGSSANLVAFSALTSQEARREARSSPATRSSRSPPASRRPSTRSIQYGAVPVFLDVDVPTYNIDVTHLEDALSPKTRAVMIAHTLGNPFDLATVSRFCEDNDLWLVEDCCDAVGATYDGRHVGHWGDFATTSASTPPTTSRWARAARSSPTRAR